MAEDVPPTPVTPERLETPAGHENVPITSDTDCPSLEDIKRGKKELWLIKVPFNFDSSSLSGETVVLNGAQDLVSSASQSNNKRYEMLSRPVTTPLSSSFKVLLPSSHQQSSWAAKHTNGQMSVVQTRHVPTADLAPCPPPSKHETPNISCRWKPFGCGDTSDASITEDTRKEKMKNNQVSKESRSLQVPSYNSENSRDQLSDLLSIETNIKVEPDTPIKASVHTPKATYPKEKKSKKNKKELTQQTTTPKNSAARKAEFKSPQQTESRLSNHKGKSVIFKVKQEPPSPEEEDRLSRPAAVRNEGFSRVNTTAETPAKTSSKSKKHSKVKTPAEGAQQAKKMNVKVKTERMSDDDGPAVKKKKKK